MHIAYTQLVFLVQVDFHFFSEKCIQVSIDGVIHSSVRVVNNYSWFGLVLDVIFVAVDYQWIGQKKHKFLPVFCDAVVGLRDHLSPNAHFWVYSDSARALHECKININVNDVVRVRIWNTKTIQKTARMPVFWNCLLLSLVLLHLLIRSFSF